MDVTSAPDAGPVEAYSRSELEAFLSDLAVEQRRVEERLEDARTRERRATDAADESEATSRLLRSTMHELRRELDTRRRQVEAEVEAIMTNARDDAASILAEAFREADRSTTAAKGSAGTITAVPAASPTPPPAPALPPVLALAADQLGSPNGHATTDEAPPAPPMTVEDAPAAAPREPLTPTPETAHEVPSAPAIAGHDPAPLVPPAPPAAAPDQPAPSASGGASGKRSSSPRGTTSPSAQADIEPIEDAPRTSRLAARFRRSRSRAPEPEPEPSSDEYLEYLRGALLDDTVDLTPGNGHKAPGPPSPPERQENGERSPWAP
jgi:hypothetical protein